MEVEVIQADRIAASKILISREAEQRALDGKADSNPIVQAFARHRTEALSGSRGSPRCVACDDRPAEGNNPCAVCGASEPRPSAASEVSIPAGMKAWHGRTWGPPKDHDYGPVMQRDGQIVASPPTGNFWVHVESHRDADIIAYTPKAPARVGNPIATFTGVSYWPLDPRAIEVDIDDIAHALSMLCRWGGHVSEFYSVAEHSVHCSYLVSPEHALTALLHDATEAYVADVPRPLKRSLAGYAEIEERNWLAIAECFGLPREMPQAVIEADNAMLFAERNTLMGNRTVWMGWPDIEPAQVTLDCLLPADAKALFMARFEVLTAVAGDEA